MEAFFVSTGVIALGEIGDKTQLLALMLAAKYRKPGPIILGILAATLVNHTLAGVVGAWVTTVIGPHTLRVILGVSFLAMAAWMLVPDKLDEDDGKDESLGRFGVFGATLVVFFLAEMGDKTQIATVALAARYGEMVPVVAGTTLGMLIADVPAVLFGHKAADRIPHKLVHGIAAVIFAGLGLWALLAGR
jgi:putative Ca2+/H+ antiporter (TMEM165/GDT1 family)